MAQHSLAFRVMRLCRPSFQAEDALLRLHPADLFAGEDFLEGQSLPPSLVDPRGGADFSFRDRFQLENPTDAMALSGLLVLPQSFGAIYLGETFCSYISINNSSSFEARDIIIKAEIQTERQRILLLDTSKTPVESIRAGGRYDFIVEHDVKELGPHTLVCTALYNDGDSERKYLPQFFKFVVANPLSVRTKVRTVKVGPVYLSENSNPISSQASPLSYIWEEHTADKQENTFLEACIENHTKSNLYMDQVEFEPAQQWTTTILKAEEHSLESNSKMRDIFKPPVLIRAGGGIYNYLYQLKQASHESGKTKFDGSNILGKLQITWRTNLGESGRLQTQQILSTSIAHKDIDLRIMEVPAVVILERPFLLHLALTSQTDKTIGPFEVFLSEGDSGEEKFVMVNGIQKLVIPPLESFGSTSFNMNMIATRLGVQRLSGITIFDTKEKKTYDPLPDLEIFVDPI